MDPCALTVFANHLKTVSWPHVHTFILNVGSICVLMKRVNAGSIVVTLRFCSQDWNAWNRFSALSSISFIAAVCANNNNG